MRKVIQNIQPWNDLYFKNCYYSAIFPMILHFNKSITPVVLNDVYIYKLDNTQGNNMLDLENQQIMDIDDILKDMGIIARAKDVPDIISELKESIDADHPVLLFIDCFYETIRYDSVNIHHWGHIILTYGYDDEVQAFDILEHKYATGFTYDTFKFSYEDAVKCYDGFLNNLRNDSFSGYIEYLPDPSFANIEYTEQDEKQSILSFINTMNVKKTEIYKGIEALKKFTENFGQLETALSSNKNMIAELKDRFDDIKRSKSVERYRLHKIFGTSSKAMKLAEELFEHWSFMAGIFNKLSHVETIYKQYFGYAVDRIKKIPDSEREYFDALYDVFDEWRVKNI